MIWVPDFFWLFFDDAADPDQDFLDQFWRRLAEELCVAGAEVDSSRLVGQHGTRDAMARPDQHLERPVADGSRDGGYQRIARDQTESSGAQDKDRTLTAVFVAGIWVEHYAGEISPIGDIGLSHG
jgi:hypothetical protein